MALALSGVGLAGCVDPEESGVACDERFQVCDVPDADGRGEEDRERCKEKTTYKKDGRVRVERTCVEWGEDDER